MAFKASVSLQSVFDGGEQAHKQDIRYERPDEVCTNKKEEGPCSGMRGRLSEKKQQQWWSGEKQKRVTKQKRKMSVSVLDHHPHQRHTVP